MDKRRLATAGLKVALEEIVEDIENVLDGGSTMSTDHALLLRIQANATQALGLYDQRMNTAGQDVGTHEPPTPIGSKAP